MDNVLRAWGMCSVGGSFLNRNRDSAITFPKEVRDAAITALKMVRFVFDTAGFIGIFYPRIGIVGGCVRFAVGAGISGYTTMVGDPDADKGTIIGRWYYEVRDFGSGQMARAAIDIFTPRTRKIRNITISGGVINFALDFFVTIRRIFVCVDSIDQQGSVLRRNYPYPDNDPHKDPPTGFLIFW